MARGPGKARDFDYSNVGTAGRRTGITLKEGRRDEHGMEEVDGLFSSPEKSPARVNGFGYDDHNGDLENGDSASSEMSMDEGNAPGPMDFLNGAHRSRVSFLAPPTRSPAKRSPRKSPILRSSPEQEEDPMASSPSDGKGMTESHQEPSPLSTRSVNAGVSHQKNSARQKLKAQLVSEPPRVHDFSDGEGDENADAYAQLHDDFDDNTDAGDETMIPDDEALESNEQDLNPTERLSSPLAASSRQTGKIAPPSRITENGTAAAPASTSNGPKKRRGRPPKSQRPAEETSDPRPVKKQKTSNRESYNSREPLNPDLERVVDNYAQRSGPLKGRSLYILKRENPTDVSSTHTRSGRVSVRPLAYWRNERCVFGDGEAAEGQRFPLSTIKEVIRTEELEPDQKKKARRGGKKAKSKKKHGEESSDEEGEEVDLWEKEGVLHGYIPKWDPKAQASTSEEEVLDIAYAPSGIETREVKDSTFRFAKLLSSSFIGSGVVELPPEGVKKPKNSKKMHMVFYVCHGRVQVDISGVQFSAGKGCVFQVPRGNYYSFMNQHQKEARLFFTQGCVPGEGESTLQSEAKSAVQESEFEPESGPSSAPTTKARGRPKGKQKATK